MDQEKWIRTWNRWFQRTCETAAGVGAAARCGAAKAGKAAENALSYTRGRVAIADKRAEVNLQLRRIGEMVYATHTGDPTDSAEMQKALEAVDALKAEISAQERALQAIRGVSVCPACGHVNPSDHVFCSNCGQSLTR